jgi:hypothetical protein
VLGGSEEIDDKGLARRYETRVDHEGLLVSRVVAGSPSRFSGR